MNRALASLLLLFLVAKVFSQARYMVLWDEFMSPNAGAENIVTAQKLLFSVEDAYLPIKFADESDGFSKTAGITYRLGKTLLLNDIFDYMLALSQHEVFGHGWAARMRGSESVYKLNLPPPYGPGGGFMMSKGGRFAGRDEVILMDIAGVQSNILLAKTVRAKWLQKKTIHYREAVFYFFGMNDMTRYVLDYAVNNAGGDISEYVIDINRRAGYFSYQKYSKNDIAYKVWANALDPFQYISMYTFLSTYLYNGEHKNELPMLQWGNISYMPSIRFGFTPFGPAFHGEVSAIDSSRCYEAGFYVGDPKLYTFWGAGINILNLISYAHISLNARLNIWNQPPVYSSGSFFRTSGGGWGGATGVEIHYRTFSDSSPFLFFHMGYKTTGYLEGETLEETPIIRVGMSLIVDS